MMVLESYIWNIFNEIKFQLGVMILLTLFIDINEIVVMKNRGYCFSLRDFIFELFI